MTPPTHPLALAALSLPAMLYGAAVRIRDRYYSRPAASRSASLPIISVGNLTVGGTGKTPIVAWLARRLRDRHRPAIISRGYGGTAGKGPLVVSRGNGPLCEPRECGDEPYLLARALRDVHIVVGSERHAGAEAAASAGCDVAILDDGFQHRRLARDLDIVLLDASNPFGNYRLLPAGLLREPVDALTRADVILITRTRPDETFDIIRRVVRHYNAVAPLLAAGHRGMGFIDTSGHNVETPARAVAFCGIGNPSRFRIDLLEAGVDVVEFRAHRDHHVYSAAEIAELRDVARQRDAVLVTTEKDLARLDPAGADGIRAFRIRAELYDPGPLVAAVERVLEGSPA